MLTNDQILAAAEQERPDLLEKTAHALRILEAMDSGFTLETATEMGTILNTGIRKTASAAPVGDAMKNLALVTGGMVLTGLGAAMATDLYESAKRGLSKASNFKRIMAANPDLHHEDQDKVRQVFSTVHRFGPEFTADPMLGGALIKQVMEMPNASPKIIMDLVSARKNMHEGQNKMMTIGHSSGAGIFRAPTPAPSKK